MKALIRRLWGDATIFEGANRKALELLATKLENDLRVVVESGRPQEAINAFREMNATLARIHAEYARLGGVSSPFAWADEKKVPVRTK